MAIKKPLTPEELLKQQLSQVAAPVNRTTDYYKPVTAPPPAPVEQYGYTPSSSVNQAYDYYAQTVKNQPGQYVNNWQTQLDELYNQIAQRPAFQYDLNGDMLYQQYKDQYQQLGQRAMMDTQGRAAELTGGYGSTYGAQAGQQAYDSYLQQLNNAVPQLESNAYNRYQGEGQDLYNLYGLTAQNEATDYSRYADQVNRYTADRGFAADQYGQERNFDYGAFTDKRNYDFQNVQFEYQKQYDAAQQAFQSAQFEWQKATDDRDFAAAESWKAKQFEAEQAMAAAQQAMAQAEFQYQKERDATAQSNWEAELAYKKSEADYAKQLDTRDFDYKQQIDAAKYALTNPAPAAAPASTSSSGGTQFNPTTKAAAAAAVKSGGNAGLLTYIKGRIANGLSEKAGNDLYNMYKVEQSTTGYSGGGR